MPRWPKRSLEERFWEKVDRNGPGGCWLWTAGLFKVGYGQISLPGSAPRLTHRLAYEFCKGEIPATFEVHHTCGVRACVNPAHLVALSKRDHRNLTSEERWAVETECTAGHPFDEENTVWGISASGARTRTCRTCLRARWRRVDQKAKRAKRKAIANQS